MPDDASANLARNIRLLRDTRNLTQQGLAKRAGVPRPTLTNLESGSANPTLSVLLKVATALQVSVEELISTPRATAKFYGADSLACRRRGGALIREVLPDAVSGLSFERIELQPGSLLRGVPHTPGTREYLTCEIGVVELTASGEAWTLHPGDVVVFRGDQKHAYRNPEDQTAVAYSVVTYAPMS